MKLLLKNGKIYDGTGAEPFFADILVENERISRVAPQIAESAERVLDLEKKSVSSGFIDAHSHNDWFALKKDQLPYLELSQSVRLYHGFHYGSASFLMYLSVNPLTCSCFLWAVHVSFSEAFPAWEADPVSAG